MRVCVLVVADTAIMRLALTTTLHHMPDVKVVGTASNGTDAISKALLLRPNLVIVDLEMSGQDSLHVATGIQRQCPQTLLALVRDPQPTSWPSVTTSAPWLLIKYLSKPDFSASLDAWAEAQISPLISCLSASHKPYAQKQQPSLPQVTLPKAVDVVLVGASTGGPSAVPLFLGGLPPDIGIPVIIVQHMPASFTGGFAQSMNKTTNWRVSEAYDRAVVRPGEAWVAKGGQHLLLERRDGALRLKLGDGPHEHGCRPSVDVLFRSASQSVGGQCVCVMLTGMGYDGSLGARALHEDGAVFVAQDEATSVVWGMPGAIVKAGLADAVLPLPEIGAWVAQQVRTANALTTRPTQLIR